MLLKKLKGGEKKMAKIEVVRNILEANDQLADQLHSLFLQHRLLTLNLMSSPGSGKTSLLEKTLTDLREDIRMAVIEGDVQTANDAQRIAATGASVVQINTDGGCHLNSAMIQETVQKFDLAALDILFIENVGNLVCPAEFNLGEDFKVTLLSVTEGDDKPEKYPAMFARSEVMIINKIDLLPYVDFSIEKAAKLSLALNANLKIFPVSCRTGEGLEAWYSWLRENLKR